MSSEHASGGDNQHEGTESRGPVQHYDIVLDAIGRFHSGRGTDSVHVSRPGAGTITDIKTGRVFHLRDTSYAGVNEGTAALQVEHPDGGIEIVAPFGTTSTGETDFVWCIELPGHEPVDIGREGLNGSSALDRYHQLLSEAHDATQQG